MNTDPMQDFYDHFPYPLTEARPNSSVNGANMFRILIASHGRTVSPA